MNQTQRKYVTQRIESIYHQKVQAIETAFNSNPINRTKTVIYPIYHDHVSVIRKLAGLESPVELVCTSEELDSLLIAGQSFNTAVIAKPLNHISVDETNAHNLAIYTRRQIEVTNRINALRYAKQECLDRTILGDDADALLYAIQEFETLEV